MTRYLLHLVLSLSILLTFTSLNAAARTVAEYAGGTVSEQELNIAIELIGSECGTCVQDYQETLDIGTFRSAEDLLWRALGDLLWVRSKQAEVRASGHRLEVEYALPMEQQYQEKVGRVFLEQKLSTIPSPTTEELVQIYHQYQGRIERPERRAISYIFRSAARAESEEGRNAQEFLESLRERIDSGALDFGDAARLYSEAPSATNRGSIGAIDQNTRINREFLNIAFSLGENEVSTVRYLRNGYYLIRCDAILPGRTFDIKTIRDNRALEEILLQYHEIDWESKIVAQAIASHGSTGGKFAALFRQAQAEGFVHPPTELWYRMARDRITARSWFYSQNRERLTPTEQDILQYYESNQDEMRESGIFRVRQVVFPQAGSSGSTSESPRVIGDLVANAEFFAKQLRDGSDLNGLVQSLEHEGVHLMEHSGWIRSTDHGDTDRLFATAPEGTLSTPVIADGKVSLFQLLERRTPPLLPLAERRSYIVRNIRLGRYNEEIESASKELVRQLGLRLLIQPQARLRDAIGHPPSLP
jgi:parvulin-like peptidyl-prolyl isomerase